MLVVLKKSIIFSFDLDRLLALCCCRLYQGRGYGV